MEELTRYMTRFPQICFRKMWDLESDVLYMLGKCESMVSALSFLPLSPELRKKMLEVSMVKGAMATTAIEGNTLSEEEVKAIQGGTASIPESRKYLETEVKNVLDALNGIHNEVVYQHRISPVSPDLILSFNKMVGKDLGENFESVPGQFRTHEVTVGTYRPPEHQYVAELVRRLCGWLQTEFGFRQEEKPNFINNVIEAIVAHVYLVWIHPFGDGNGRTARLLEFYILLRGGFPNICSHILSNHYNTTRNEYYKQLDHAGKTCSLEKFIRYAVQGLTDGLCEVMSMAQRHQLVSCWKNYIYSEIDKMKISKPVHRRYAQLLTNLDIFAHYKVADLVKINAEVAVLYAQSNARMIQRDATALMEAKLLVRNDDGTVSANISTLVDRLPNRRAFID